MSKITTTMNRIGWPSWLAAWVWAGAAAGVVYWALLLTSPAAVPVNGLANAPATPTPATPAVAKALGDAATVPQAAAPIGAQYKLLGVIASGTGQGSALIAVDGQPPKAFRVGQDVSENLKLVSLGPRQARLRSAGRELVLDLPANSQAQTDKN